MAPIKQGYFQIPTSRISPHSRLLLLLPFSLLVFAIIRRVQGRKMASSEDSSAKKYSRAIDISSHTGEKLQIRLSIEEASPPDSQVPPAMAGESNSGHLEAPSLSNPGPPQPFDMTSLPLPSAAKEMKNHTMTLSEREFTQPESSSGHPDAPRLQKEAVQIFKEVGSKSRKNWRRKVLEYH
ncbi:hypothetical protein TRV_04026 [Trichophyton verrucosum HKI 0517]|uniref:Uncharacterized protein n=1 Tax=Trichophyton verrucosum (strain HKI 0517) TaxID=663202 RepID=D4DA80_TRIVH|nr:uncharacterized protein TRV_04026 [Trichophyton verrucosum HKI 0517]EFE41231.1 hypothetical protein TRV_04026 [Trichophyton verrucosum HKI 0517]